jgi:hypothetical protein
VEPLAPVFREWTLPPQRAGGRAVARLVLVNDGAATWRSRGTDGLQLSYHWLDAHLNAIVWDGLRTAFPRPVAPGETVALDVALVAPRPPGRYVLRFDFVEEHRFWLSEVGVGTLDLEVAVEPGIAERRLAVVVHGGEDERTTAALAAQEEAVVEDEPAATAHLVAGAEPASDWSRLVLDAHSEGWDAVGPALVPGGGGPLERRRTRRALRPWAPGGRNPRPDVPLLLPSLHAGLEPVDHDGLPAHVGEGIFEGRAVVRLPTRSGRRPR